MMQKRTLYSLLLISFIVVFGFSFATANDVTIQSKNVSRCSNAEVNVTANVTSDSVSAIEVVVVVNKTLGCALLENLTVSWAPGFTQLPSRVIDYTKVNGTDPDTIRFAAFRVNPLDAVLGAGSKVIAQIKFKSNDCCAGTVGIVGGEFTYPNPTSPIVTQFVDAASQAVVPAALVAGTVTIVNVVPTLAAISNATLPWGGVHTATAVATDLDAANGCEVITYTKLVGPTTMVVNPTTGAILWGTTSADVGTHAVSIVATDKCGATATVSYTICVTNAAPIATNPANFDACLQTTVTTNVVATDPDGGPGGLLYAIASSTAPAGSVTVHPTTGLVTFVIGNTADYTGNFQICIKVQDGAPVSPCSPANADTACFSVNVRSMNVTIQKQHGPAGKGVLWGQPTTVDISMLSSVYKNFAIGGYDFLIQYDNSVLTFMSAAAGDFLTGCKWEYFTYRNGYNGNCGNGCPSGLIRIVAMAETNNGVNQNPCFVNTGAMSNQLAQLTFLVTNNRNYDCAFVPVRFFWMDCGDNGLSNPDGDTLLISNNVYDWYSTVGGNETYNQLITAGATLPTAFGAPSPVCNTSVPGKGKPVRCANFYNGGVDIICADSIDSRGDINLNGIDYEIADAVMFTNYFIHGPSAFQGHPDGSMAASDVNGDGLTLTVADLVQLIRVVIGDATGLPKEVAGTSESVNANYTNERGIVGVDTELGAAFVIAKGNVTPELIGSATTRGLSYNYDATTDQTRILVHPTLTEAGFGAVIGFSGEFLNVGSAQVISVEASTTTGSVVVFKLVPKNFALAQNYPNPFNPSTTINFDLPKPTAWTLTVYNIAGQVVETFNGEEAAPGTVTVTFDGTNRASGLYLYRLTAGDYTSVKKMVMIK